jgi:hypothetical protein
VLTIEIDNPEGGGAVLVGLAEAELDRIDAGQKVKGESRTLGWFSVGPFGGASERERRFDREQYLALYSTAQLRRNGRQVIDTLGRLRVILAGCCGDGLKAWRDHAREVELEESERLAT